jgi:carbonic anhydrase/acetyltransferase-like protein (isoleucine patch superfamily)
MALYEFEGRRPRVGASSYVHPRADVVGDVVIGERCWVGPGACIRGDIERISVGDGSSVQDNAVLHTREGLALAVGRDVTVGHGAVLHSCTVGDGAVVGMGAVVTDLASVGAGAIVAEGAVVKARQAIPPNAIAAGVPAKVVGEVSAEQREAVLQGLAHYADLCQRYRAGLRQVGEG